MTPDEAEAVAAKAMHWTTTIVVMVGSMALFCAGCGVLNLFIPHG